MVKGDNAAAVGFLDLWRKGGPWVLTAIQPDRKGIETKTLTNKKELTEFLEKWNGERNIYFNVNSVIREISTKATREDIASLDWLHIDIDPREDKDIHEERDRALALLTEKLPKNIPPPTCVVFSGGGYQGFWKLKTPVVVDGSVEKAEEVKAYNQHLEHVFGGDHCHNIDRIMRLPGTVNIPDAKKLAKGREPTKALLMSFNVKLSYDISEFKKQPKIHDKHSNFGSNISVDIDDIPEVTDVSFLDKWDVPDRVKIIAVQGRHPDETKKNDNSRSAWLFDFITNCIRCKVPDGVILSIITNSLFGISDSVLEAKPTPHQYAVRQIARAKEIAIDPKLAEMNERHAVISNTGGKCRIIEELFDDVLERQVLTWSSFDDFRNRYMNQLIQVGVKENGDPVLASLGKWWLNHKNRRQYRKVVFLPGENNKASPEDYNLWRGFSVLPKPGDWSLYRGHLLRNICGGSEAYFDYLIKWMARCVQHPATPGEVAIVLRGGRGTGKSKAAKVFGSLFGRHMLQISNAEHLVGRFNAHLRDCLVLFADEAFYAGDKRHESVLKTLITEESIQIEQKLMTVETQPNFIHMIMASNQDWVVPAGPDERRFFVLDVGEENKKDHKFFSDIDEQMENGGKAGFLYDLMNLDLTGFNVRSAPQTAALMDQKRRSLGVVEEWWYRRLMEGILLPHHEKWEGHCITGELYTAFTKYMEKWKIQARGMNETVFGRELSAVTTVNRVQRRVYVEKQDIDGIAVTDKRRLYCYEFETLQKARKTWEDKFGTEKWVTLKNNEMDPM